jgi:hypothetical protein
MMTMRANAGPIKPQITAPRESARSHGAAARSASATKIITARKANSIDSDASIEAILRLF